MKEELLLTLTGVFAWVASADEGANAQEYQKFTHAILESPFASQYSETDLDHAYKDMVDLFLKDFDLAMNLTLERMDDFSEDPLIKTEILRLARAAVVGDGKIHQSEENALTIIKKQLALK
ncbi:MAG: hypothetical protein KDD61_00855 [Bdellovibrionales bacterium]|nr:hypothetical protein [Bdellovibrionales bacterium]